MDKYRLKLKGWETIDKQDKEKYGISEYKSGMDYLAYYNDSCSFCDYESLRYDDNEAKFNQDDIDKIPSGLLRKLSVIKIEEKMYRIRLPHVDKNNPSKYINLWENGTTNLSDIIDLPDKRTKFTKNEIESMYPYYANSYFMEEVDENDCV